MHILGDLIAASLLAVLGAIGFNHDNKNYLDDGIWREYDDGDWLSTEIWAGSVMLASL